MKQQFAFIVFAFIFCLGGAAQESGKAKKARQQFEISQLINGGKFRFVPRSAHSNLGNFNHLTTGYELVFDSLRIRSYLPYYGRAYSVEYGGSGGVVFDLTAEQIEKQWNEKKKLYTLSVELSEIKDSYSIILRISLSGYADLTIHFRNRQWISYFGNIERIPKPDN